MMDIGKEVFNQNVLEFYENIRSIGWQPRTNHILDEKLCARKCIWAKIWGKKPTKLMHLSLNINT